MIIDLKNRKEKFNLKMSGKYNIITGNSGTKKTHFLKTLVRYKRNVSSVFCTIIDDFGNKIDKDKIFILENESTLSVNYHLIFSSVQGAVFIIDETSEILSKRDIGKVFKESKNYFIIITREVLGWLPISIDSIYTLQSKNNTIVNTPKFCELNSDLTHIGEVDFILTEDSASGREFFKNFFPTKRLCSRRSEVGGKLITNDNSHLHKVLDTLRGKETNILIVFDAAAYGAFYDLLMTSIEYFNGNVSILSWDSFETYLLSCPKLSINLTKKNVNYNYNSLEQLSVLRLSSELNGYDKRSLPLCIKQDFTFIQYPLTDIQ